MQHLTNFFFVVDFSDRLLVSAWWNLFRYSRVKAGSGNVPRTHSSGKHLSKKKKRKDVSLLTQLFSLKWPAIDGTPGKTLLEAGVKLRALYLLTQVFGCWTALSTTLSRPVLSAWIPTTSTSTALPGDPKMTVRFPLNPSLSPPLSSLSFCRIFWNIPRSMLYVPVLLRWQVFALFVLSFYGMHSQTNDRCFSSRQNCGRTGTFGQTSLY